MKLIIIAVLLAVAFGINLMAYEAAHTCPHDLEAKCIHEVNTAYAKCQEAAKQKGSDVIADLECLKYFAQMGEDCYDCICWVAEINHWTIKGC